MGVGTREMGYLFGQYRRLAGHFQVLNTCNKLFSDIYYIFISRCFFVFRQNNVNHLAEPLQLLFFVIFYLNKYVHTCIYAYT